MSRCNLSVGPGQGLMDLVAGLAVPLPTMAGRTIDHGQMGTFPVAVATFGNVVRRQWPMTLMTIQAGYLRLMRQSSGSNLLIFLAMALSAILNRQHSRSLCRFQYREGQYLQED